MVFTCEKHDTSNQNRERCFFTCEWNDTSNVSFAPKFPPFIAACSSASHTFNEKSFTQRVFLAKKVKNISETALVVFVSEILLVHCAHSFDFWYGNNSCVKTVRQPFPWSILYNMLKVVPLFCPAPTHYLQHITLQHQWGRRFSSVA